MKLSTKYSLVSLLTMVTIFIFSVFLLQLMIRRVLVNEMTADLSGIQKKVEEYVSKYDAFPKGFPLDEELLACMPSGRHRPARRLQLTQLFSPRENKMHNYMKLIFPLFLHGDWYSVSVAKPLEGMHHLSRAMVSVSITAVLLIIALSVLLGHFVVDRLWQPFFASVKLVSNFKVEAAMLPVFPETTTTEFSLLIKSLRKGMQKALFDYQALKTFSENASHEMQTPLAVVRSKLDIMIQDEHLSEKQSKLLQQTYASVRKLSRLNHSLLLLAKIENHQFTGKQQIDLQQKVTEKAEDFQELWQNRRLVAFLKLRESSCSMNEELLDILLNNLLSNATNHNLPEGFISIALESNVLTISNSGNQPLDSSKLFTRFYTAAAGSRSGLGLTISKQVAEVSGIALQYAFTGNAHEFTVRF